jgi:predicted GNAT family acetyltransferase
VTDAVDVRDNPDEARYEAYLDGRVAGFAAYRADGNVLVFTHTEVDDSVEGQGVGSALAEGALSDVRERGLHVVPQCQFIAAYIEHHKQFADLVQDGGSQSSSASR